MRSAAVFLTLSLAVVTAPGCSTAPPSEAEFSWEFYSAPAMSPNTFSGRTLAVLPTVSIDYDATQQTYRETLAGLLYDELQKYPDGPHILSLGALQSGINRSGLWNDAMQMYNEYQKTGVLRKDILSRIGKAVNARYVILPRLLRFQSEAFDRATVIGISFLRTRQSNVDIQAQIWDTLTGAVVWDGASEGSLASEVVRGQPASFMAVAKVACRSLVSKMPWVKELKRPGEALAK